MSTSELLNAPKEFLKLYQAGKNAAKQGRNAQAHELLRQAIEIDPYHEQVWLWLASVVETDDDRRVCFENVLELNPDNQTAREQLRVIEHRAIIETMHAEPFGQDVDELQPRNHLRVVLFLLLLLAIALVVLILSIQAEADSPAFSAPWHTPWLIGLAY